MLSTSGKNLINDLCADNIYANTAWCALLRDRRKLTFYFVAEKRIDFRELVRELFRCVTPILRAQVIDTY
jgi:hypothetical protein